MEKPTAVIQTSFASGELTPALFGRIDLATYYSALKICRNFIVRPYGGVSNRPGTKFVTEVKDSGTKVRLIPFQYASDDTYVLEFGDFYIRILKNGGYLLDGESPLEIVTPWGEDVLYLLKFVQSGDVMTICHAETYPRQLSRFAEDNWTLTNFANTDGPFMDLNIDANLSVSASAFSGDVTLTATDDLFTSDMEGRLFIIEQHPDIFVSAWEVQKVIGLNEIYRAGQNYYQAISAGTTGTLRPSATEGTERDGAPGVTWKYLHNGRGIVRINTVNSATSASATVVTRLPEGVVTVAVSKTITGVTSGVAPSFPDPGTLAQVICPNHGFDSLSTVTISGVLGATQVNGTHQITVIDQDTFELGAVYATSAYTSGGIASEAASGIATYKWALEAWGGEQGFPQCTTYYQQRQIFGGRPARPHQVNMSNSGAFTNFGQSVPLLDDEAVNFELVANRKLEIRHFIVMRDLVALTSEGPWSIVKEIGTPVPVCTAQGKVRISHVPPLEIDGRALYVPHKGSTVRSIGYNWEQDGYDAKDLTIRAAHLFFGKAIKEWTHQESPFNCVWCVLNDGSLVGMTYVPDQDVVAWHRHDTDGLFESICCVTEGEEDVVYVVVKRTVDGESVRFVEKMMPRFPTDSRDYFFVDSGLTYDGREHGSGKIYNLSTVAGWTYQDTLTFTTEDAVFVGASDVGDVIVLTDVSGEDLRLEITAYISPTSVSVSPHKTVPDDMRNGMGWKMARNTLSGLDHLEGKTVAICADANVAERQVVTSGTVTLSISAVVAHVGLPIEADIETLNINSQGQTLTDKYKNVGSVILQVEESRGLMAGPDADHLLMAKPELSGYYGGAVTPSEGVVEMNILSNWSTGGRVFVRQEEPLPATILTVIPQVVVGNV